MNRDMNLYHNVKEKLLPILVNRTAIFFFLICLFTLFLYAAGTVQGFIDSTQLFLLSFYVFTGIFLTVASISGIVINIKRLILNKKARYLLRAGGYIFLVIFAYFTGLAVIAIISISAGNS